MLRESSAQALVYQVLDDVLSGASIPATARGIMFSVVDGLAFKLRASGGRTPRREYLG